LKKTGAIGLQHGRLSGYNVSMRALKQDHPKRRITMRARYRAMVALGFLLIGVAIWRTATVDRNRPHRVPVAVEKPSSPIGNEQSSTPIGDEPSSTPIGPQQLEKAPESRQAATFFPEPVQAELKAAVTAVLPAG
jgi:hypothetical protein